MCDRTVFIISSCLATLESCKANYSLKNLINLNKCYILIRIWIPGFLWLWWAKENQWCIGRALCSPIPLGLICTLTFPDHKFKSLFGSPCHNLFLQSCFFFLACCLSDSPCVIFRLSAYSLLCNLTFLFCEHYCNALTRTKCSWRIYSELFMSSFHLQEQSGILESFELCPAAHVAFTTLHTLDAELQFDSKNWLSSRLLGLKWIASGLDLSCRQ